MKGLSKIPFPFFVLSVLLFLIVVGFLTYTNFIYIQGFNPSDDGVILAQSYRIINGEIPHQDFISLRPALSGYLHTLEFIMPGPLIPNGRWIVVSQYFIISCCFSYVLIQTLQHLKLGTSLILYAASCLLLFWTCGIRFFLFPWTTLDAMFFSAIALLFLSKFLKAKAFNKRSRNQALLFLTLFAIATLCRQTFAVVYLAGAVILLARFRSSNQLLKKVAILATSSLPFLLYVLIVWSGGPLANLTSQLSGQTSFFEIAIEKYINVLVADKTFFISCLFALILTTVARFSNHLIFQKVILVATAIIALLCGLFYGHQVAIADALSIEDSAFKLYWIVFVLILIHWILAEKKKVIFLLLFTLGICWASSISVGNNSLSFCAGIILLSLFVLSFRAITSILERPLFSHLGIAGLVIVFAFFGQRSFESQKFFNYRDAGQQYLTYELDMFPEFGEIRTNIRTHKYYTELKEIFELYPDTKDQFIMVPNNAVIYPLVDSRSPLPTDWMQPAEFLGQEERLHTALSEEITKEKLYIIWDKLNSKRMYEGRFDEVHSKYSYAPIIKENCTKIFETTQFYVFCSQP